METSEFNALAKSGKWENWHKSLKIGGKVVKVFTPSNGLPYKKDKKFLIQDKEFKKGLRQLRELLAERVAAAEKEPKKIKEQRLRAFGSRWSLDNIAYNGTYMINSIGLNYCKVGMDASLIRDDYRKQASQLCFVQAGVFVKSLNQALAGKKLALPTTGASDGQKFVGAASTGTHGSANRIGAMQDYVKGIHFVIPDPNDESKIESIFLQKESGPADPLSFGEWLDGSRVVSNDELFKAALVSFGSFGLIHGMLIEAVPQYFCDLHSKQLTFEEVQPLLASKSKKELAEALAKLMDWTSDAALPYHFEVGLNPCQLGQGEQGAFVRILKETPAPPSGLAAQTAGEYHSIHDGIARSFAEKLKEMGLEPFLADAKLNENETIALLEKARQTLPSDLIAELSIAVSQLPAADPEEFIGGFKGKLISKVIQYELKKFYQLKDETEFFAKHVLPSHVFSSKNSTDKYTSEVLKGTSLEVSLPLARWEDAVNLIRKIAVKQKLPAPMGMRLVKPSEATLAFTRFEDLTVTIELPGPYGNVLFRSTSKIHRLIFEALAASDIPHSYHWGQQMPKNSSWPQKSYQSKLGEWKKQRKKFLGPIGAVLFSNELTDKIGVTEGRPVA